MLEQGPLAPSQFQLNTRLQEPKQYGQQVSNNVRQRSQSKLDESNFRETRSSHKQDSGSFGAMMHTAWRKYHKKKYV
jgi:hypothetical protein